MNAYVRSEREDLEEKLELLYKERREAIGNEERFKQLCREIDAIVLKFFTWDKRSRRNVNVRTDFGSTLLTLKY